MNRNISHQPFFIGLNNRAMISLGPLNKKRYCPYNCAYCYVNHGFPSYNNYSNSEIITFLKNNRSKFDIIYISGDTDSFAPPRTKRALDLLEEMIELKTDIMFTTRTTFNKKSIKRLEYINRLQAINNKILFGSISIPRFNTADYIESKNTPSPQSRILCLKTLNEIGISTILAIRPLLPIIHFAEYCKLIDKSSTFVKAILGEELYLDPNGVIIKQIFRGNPPQHNTFIKKKMDFNLNQNSIWQVWKDPILIKKIQKYCNDLKIPFYMRSSYAVDYIRNKKY